MDTPNGQPRCHRLLTQAGYTIAVATNQSGIGRGLFTMQELSEMHQKMHKLVQQAGGQIDGIWFAPTRLPLNANLINPNRAWC